MSTAAIVGALVACLSFWDVYGWITKSAYAQDHKVSVQEQNQTIITSLEALNSTLDIIKKEQKKNQDQWECDETDEELQDLGEKEDSEGLSPTDKRNKTKLDEVWIGKDCKRFTD